MISLWLAAISASTPVPKRIVNQKPATILRLDNLVHLTVSRAAIGSIPP